MLARWLFGLLVVVLLIASLSPTSVDRALAAATDTLTLADFELGVDPRWVANGILVSPQPRPAYVGEGDQTVGG
jgi:hypothetical protein